MSKDVPNVDLELEDAIVNSAPKEGNPDTDRPVPDKFKGKSVFDMIDMYENAQRKISEQGGELGALRRTADELLGLRKENTPKEKIRVTTEDILTDPDQALNKVIEQSPTASKANEISDRLDVLERSIGQQDFEGRFPEFIEDVSNPEFQSWVKNNRARSSLLVELNQNYNFEAGTALWEMWDEHKKLSKTPEPDKKAAIASAKTVRNSPSESARKPVYSRAKLLELQTKAIRGDRAAQARWNDPGFQKEYQDAYAEGRVK